MFTLWGNGNFQQLGEENFWLGIGIYRFCLVGGTDPGWHYGKKEDVGGGVAIVCHKKAKRAERKTEVKGLEAIWAEIIVNSSYMIVWSVSTAR